MKQERVYTIPQLITSSGQAIGGATLHGAAINLFHNTAPIITGERNAFIVARNHYESGRVELADRRSELEEAIEAARAFVTLVRELLKPKLGKRYSQKWDVTGFKGALKVPSRPGELFALLTALQAYLAANLAINNEQLQVNAAKASELGSDLVELVNAVNAQIAEVKRLLEVRNAAMERLRRRMMGLVAELTQLISGLDARWLSFGLNMPGATERPEAPKNVSVVRVSETELGVKWEKTPRATHYRVWLQVEGRDGEFLPIGSAKDLDFTIESVPMDATVRIALSAVNPGGESGKREVGAWLNGYMVASGTSGIADRQ